MRPCAALPVSSPTATNGSRDSGEVGVDIPAAAVGEREGSVATVLRDAVRIGERRASEPIDPPALAPPPLDAGEGAVGVCRAQLAPAFRHGARIARAARAIAAKILHAVRQVDVVAAEPALGQHARRCRPRASPAPSRAASTTMRASRGGSGRRRSAWPSAVMRPSVERAELGEQRARLGERALRRRIEEGERLRRRAPGREIEHEGRQVGREDLRARDRLRARRSAARPTGGSRRRARCGRRGRGAGRRRRARRARSRAASARRPARSAARARGRNRPRCARPRW